MGGTTSVNKRVYQDTAEYKGVHFQIANFGGWQSMQIPEIKSPCDL